MASRIAFEEAAPDRLLDAIHQIVVVKRLKKVADDPLFQSPRPSSLVGIARISH
jgi:hypothetical protein